MTYSKVRGVPTNLHLQDTNTLTLNSYLYRTGCLGLNHLPCRRHSNPRTIDCRRLRGNFSVRPVPPRLGSLSSETPLYLKETTLEPKTYWWMPTGQSTVEVRVYNDRMSSSPTTGSTDDRTHFTEFNWTTVVNRLWYSDRDTSSDPQTLTGLSGPLFGNEEKQQNGVGKKGMGEV